jgi:hypothetical protein
MHKQNCKCFIREYSLFIIIITNNSIRINIRFSISTVLGTNCRALKRIRNWQYKLTTVLQITQMFPKIGYNTDTKVDNINSTAC